jgi:PAS domain S-box-containing protein
VTPSSSAQINVLHVDDNPSFLTLTRRYLERSDDDLQVVSVDDPQEALERLRSDETIECVLSDYEMPGLSGLDFLRRVRAHRPTMPFILYTARGDEAVAADAIGAGVSDYIRKDSDKTHYLTLSVRIRREVERARAEAERETRLAALEAAREGICIVDADGRVSYANESYLDLYGYERETLLGSRWELLHPEEEVAFLTSEVLPQVEADGGWEGESRGRRADETTFRESKSVTPLPNGGLVIVATSFSRSDDAPEPSG